MDIITNSFTRFIGEKPPEQESGTLEVVSTKRSYPLFNKGIPAMDTFVNNKKKSPSFTSVNKAMADLRKYANDFRCAYTGSRMIGFNTYKHLLELAVKKNKTDKNLINHVYKYNESMDGVELSVLNFYRHNINNSKLQTIKAVTEQQFPISYNKLKSQYLKVINKLRTLSANIHNEKLQKRYNAILDCWEEDLLKNMYKDAINMKKYPMILQKMKYGNKNDNVKELVNKTLNTLPSATDDFDAFIVKHKDATKKQFINNLISPFIVTIEHIRAKQNGGHASSLANCILVRSKENCQKSNTPLDITLAQHPEWIQHIQEYYQNVVDKVNNGGLKNYRWYPFEIKKTLENESHNRLHLDTTRLKISEEDAYKDFIA